MSQRDGRLGAAMQFVKGQELIIQLPSSGKQIIGTWDGSQLRVGSSLHLLSNANPGQDDQSDENNPHLCNNGSSTNEMDINLEDLSSSFVSPSKEKIDDPVVKQLRSQLAELRETNWQLLRESNRLRRDMMAVQEAARSEVRTRDATIRRLQQQNADLKAQLSKLSMKLEGKIEQPCAAAGDATEPDLPESVLKTSPRHLSHDSSAQSPPRDTHATSLVKPPELIDLTQSESSFMNSKSNPCRSSDASDASSVRASSRSLFETIRGMVKEVKASPESNGESKPEGVRGQEGAQQNLISSIQNALRSIQTGKEQSKAKEAEKLRPDRRKTLKHKPLKDRDIMAAYIKSSDAQTKAKIISSKEMRKLHNHFMDHRPSPTPTADRVSAPEPVDVASLPTENSSPKAADTCTPKDGSKPTQNQDTKGIDAPPRGAKITPPQKHSRTQRRKLRLEQEEQVRKAEEAANQLKKEQKLAESSVGPSPAVQQIMASLTKSLHPVVTTEQPSIQSPSPAANPSTQVMAIMGQLKASVSKKPTLPLESYTCGSSIYKRLPIEPQWKLKQLEVGTEIVHHRNQEVKGQLLQAIWLRRDPRKWAPVQKKVLEDSLAAGVMKEDALEEKKHEFTDQGALGQVLNLGHKSVDVGQGSFNEKILAKASMTSDGDATHQSPAEKVLAISGSPNATLSGKVQDLKPPDSFKFIKPAPPCTPSPLKKLKVTEEDSCQDDLFNLAIFSEGAIPSQVPAMEDEEEASLWSICSTEPPASPLADQPLDGSISPQKSEASSKTSILFADLYMSDTEDCSHVSTADKVEKEGEKSVVTGEINFQNSLRDSVDNILESLQESDHESDEGQSHQDATNKVNPAETSPETEAKLSVMKHEESRSDYYYRSPKKRILMAMRHSHPEDTPSAANTSPECLEKTTPGEPLSVVESSEAPSKEFTFREDILNSCSSSEYVSPKKKPAAALKSVTGSQLVVDEDAMIINIHPTPEEEDLVFSEDENSSAAQSLAFTECKSQEDECVSQRIAEIIDDLDETIESGELTESDSGKDTDVEQRKTVKTRAPRSKGSDTSRCRRRPGSGRNKSPSGISCRERSSQGRLEKSGDKDGGRGKSSHRRSDRLPTKVSRSREPSKRDVREGKFSGELGNVSTRILRSASRSRSRLSSKSPEIRRSRRNSDRKVSPLRTERKHSSEKVRRHRESTHSRSSSRSRETSSRKSHERLRSPSKDHERSKEGSSHFHHRAHSRRSSRSQSDGRSQRSRTHSQDRSSKKSNEGDSSQSRRLDGHGQKSRHSQESTSSRRSLTSPFRRSSCDRSSCERGRSSIDSRHVSKYAHLSERSRRRQIDLTSRRSRSPDKPSSSRGSHDRKSSSLNRENGTQRRHQPDDHCSDHRSRRTENLLGQGREDADKRDIDCRRGVSPLHRSVSRDKSRHGSHERKRSDSEGVSRVLSHGTASSNARSDPSEHRHKSRDAHSPSHDKQASPNPERLPQHSPQDSSQKRSSLDQTSSESRKRRRTSESEEKMHKRRR